MSALYNYLKNVKVESFFLFVSISIGLLYVFLLPPFQSVDEPAHFFRGLGIAKGDFLAQRHNERVGSFLPKDVFVYAHSYNYLIKNIDAKTKTQTVVRDKTNVFTEYPNTALYSPVAYAPQICAGIFDLSPQVTFYLGRLLNLFAWCIFGYLAVKIIPFCKLPLALLLTLPMSLSLGASLTSDVMLIGLNAIWFALILKLTFSKVANKDIFWLFVLAVLISLCKSYFMLIFLVFLIPMRNFKSKKNYFLTTLGILFVSLAVTLWWVGLVKGLVVPLNGETNTFLQLDFIKSHPLTYLLVLLKSIIVKLPRVVITMIGVLGWQDTRLDFVTYFLYPVLFYLSIRISSNPKFVFKKWQQILLGSIFVFGCLIVITYMYLSWSPVGGSLIYGLNGKYFLPLMPLLLPLIYTNKKFKNEALLKAFIFLAILVLLLSSNLSILHRFYDFTPNLYYRV